MRNFLKKGILTLALVSFIVLIVRADPPTTPSSGLNFTNIGGTQMTLSWTSGDGAARIVIARAGAPIGADPEDGVDYVLYQTVETEQLVVYDGTGSSFTYANDGNGPLTPGITYHFEIFEYNGSGATTEYLTSSTLTGSQILESQGSEPSTASSGWSISNITGTSMDLGWTSGDGDGRIIIAREGGAVTANPVDGITYTQYQDLGGGNIVIYTGTGNSHAFTSMGMGPLSVGTTYQFTIFEYNGSGLDRNYLTTLTLKGTQATESPGSEPTQAVTNVSVDFKTDQPEQRIDLSWVGGNGANYLLVMRAGAAVTWTPTDGTGYNNWTNVDGTHWVVQSGSATSIEIKSDGLDDLDDETVYHFRVYNFNGTDATSNYLTSSFFTTSTSTVGTTVGGAATGLNFTSIEGTQFDVNWTPNGGASSLIIAKEGSAVDVIAAYDLPEDGTTYNVNQDLGSGNYVVYNGSGSSFTFDDLGGMALTQNTTYHFSIIQYNGGAGAENYLNESGGQDLTGSQATLGLATEPTTAPSSLIFSDISNISMTLTWTNGNGAERIVVFRENAAVTQSPVDGQSYSQFQDLGGGNLVAYTGSSNTFVFSSDGDGPLNAGSTYHFRIFEYNGSGSTTNYLTSSFLTGSETATSGTSEPTLATSNLSFTDIMQDEMTLNWTVGDGANRLIIAKKNSAVTFTPTDSDTYSLYQTVATDEIVVYNSNGASFVFANDGTGPLETGATYHFAFFEYNGSGVNTNYLTVGFLTGSQATSSFDPEPTVAPSVLNFTSVMSDEMTLNWTDGDGSNVLVVFREGSAVTFTPTDGTGYSNYQTVAPGEVVIYGGTGTSYRFANTGSGPLSPSTTYHFALFEFNGSAQSSNYLTSSFLTGNQTTSPSSFAVVGDPNDGTGRNGDLVGVQDSDDQSPRGLFSQPLKNLRMYPNPVTNFLTLRSEGFSLEEAYALTIYDSMGKIIMQRDDYNSDTIDVSGFDDGIYILNLTTRTASFVKRFIVK